MSRIVECIPNFSEGRNPQVVNAIAETISSVKSAKVLDIHSDIDHNRSVITFICDPEHSVVAGFNAYQKAAELIDMRIHKGVHPRIGACDVFPFVPIENFSMEEAAELSTELGRRVGTELNIPVYLYEFSAKNEERKNLANIRRGQYEELAKTIESDPSKLPDFGPRKMNLKSGATAIGARGPLIAFNVNLDTQDKSKGRIIANAISESKGGFKFVKSLAFEIKSKNQIQVSMNLTNYKVTNIGLIYEFIKKESKEMGLKIASSEIVGLIPFEAAQELIKLGLQLGIPSDNKILETRIEQAIKVEKI